MTQERRVVADSGILCPGCRKANLLIEEPGSETPRWAHCPNAKCGWYIYWVGRICCTMIAENILTEGEQSKLKELLGPPTLQPWVLKHIKETRRKLGLEEG